MSTKLNDGSFSMNKSQSEAYMMNGSALWRKIETD